MKNKLGRCGSSICALLLFATGCPSDDSADESGDASTVGSDVEPVASRLEAEGGLTLELDGGLLEDGAIDSSDAVVVSQESVVDGGQQTVQSPPDAAIVTEPDASCGPDASGAPCSDDGVLGNDSFETADMWRTWTVELDTAFFIPVVAPHRSTLDSFHLRGAAKGGTCRMALYADDAGTPGQLLAIGFSVLPVDIGVQTVAADWRAPLSGGQTYWIGGKCSHATGVQLYQRSITAGRYFRFAHVGGTFAHNPQGELRTGLTFPFFVTTQPAAAAMNP